MKKIDAINILIFINFFHVWLYFDHIIKGILDLNIFIFYQIFEYTYQFYLIPFNLSKRYLLISVKFILLILSHYYVIFFYNYF